jgi:hypothetical protein
VLIGGIDTCPIVFRNLANPDKPVLEQREARHIQVLTLHDRSAVESDAI